MIIWINNITFGGQLGFLGDKNPTKADVFVFFIKEYELDIMNMRWKD
jgi:hypothetical protein